MTTIKAVLFDFDGTLSTLRAGWEQIMKPFMKASIIGDAQLSEEQEAQLDKEIDDYIDHSAGIQTIYQMKWLADTVREKGWNAQRLDEWAYKAEYNRRLLAQVAGRVERLVRGELQADHYLMAGAADFVRELFGRGIDLYIASGTDHPDVVREAEALGLAGYFREIAGAPVGKTECAKEKVLRDLIDAKGIAGQALAVIGDGKVEIRLAKEAGGLAFGLASDEARREGINPVKRRRLLEAGADWVAGDFLNRDEWLAKLGL